MGEETTGHRAPTMAEEAAALGRAGYPNPLFDRNEYVPTQEDIDRAMRGEGPPPGWKPNYLNREKCYHDLGGNDIALLKKLQERDREAAARREAASQQVRQTAEQEFMRPVGKPGSTSWLAQFCAWLTRKRPIAVGEETTDNSALTDDELKDRLYAGLTLGVDVSAGGHVAVVRAVADDRPRVWWRGDPQPDGVIRVLDSWRNPIALCGDGVWRRPDTKAPGATWEDMLDVYRLVVEDVDARDPGQLRKAASGG